MRNDPPTDGRDLQHVLITIKNNYASLSHVLKKLADYIVENTDKAPYQNISEMAKQSGVSEASITNFVKLMGFRGFSDFKICLAKNNGGAMEQQVYGDISLDDSIDDICDKVFSKNIETLNSTHKILDRAAIERAASLIVKAKRIDFYGQGSSVLPALYAIFRLQRIGIRALYYQDPHLQVTSAALLEKGDVAVGISNSGRTHDTIDSLAIAKKSGATTICITSNDGSPIIKVSDIKLLAAQSNADIIEDIVVSRLAELSILDALYICIAGKIKKRALDGLYATAEALSTKKHKK